MDRFQSCVQQHFVLLTFWLKVNQFVCISCDFVCVSRVFLETNKGSHWYYPWKSSYLPDFVVVRNDPRQKWFLQFCGFLSSVNCFSSRTVFTEKEHDNNRKVVAERGCCMVKEEDLVVNKVPRKWVLLEDFNNPNDEWLWGRFWWFPIRKQKWIKRIIGWSISRRVDIWLFSRKWNHNTNSTTFWWVNILVQIRGVDRRLVGFYIYSARRNEKKTSIEESTCRRRRNVQRATQPRISKSNRWSHVFQEYVETPFQKGSSQCVFLEILSVQSSKKRNFRIFIAFAVLKRRLDGQLADVRLEWRTKTIQYLADVARENVEVLIRGETGNNLITMMFIVASEVTEAQWEIYKFSFS